MVQTKENHPVFYKYFSDNSLRSMKYSEAKLFCENMDSTLAAITNQDEYDFVHSEKLFSNDIDEGAKRKKRAHNDPRVWIGAFFNGSEYVWLQNENLEKNKSVNFDYFTNWRTNRAPGEASGSRYPHISFINPSQISFRHAFITYKRMINIFHGQSN